MAAVPNDFFGRAIAVAGLLTGRDIQRHLAALPDLGDEVLIPAVAVRDVDGVFLDDLTPKDLESDLGVPVRVVEPTARALLAALRARSIRPIVALVGRPNVGKSTLFNRLIGRRQAIVRDVPGVTRDRLYGPVVFERWQATAIDTGGLDPGSQEPLVEAVKRQVMIAVEEADVVIFVVDARDGATGLDLEIARILRRAGRPIVVAANKIEGGRGQEAAAADFFGLGFGEPVPISAEHGRGVAELLEVVRARAPQTSATGSTGPPLNLAVIGRPNVGKSSLVNAMVGAERVLVDRRPGTTRDAVDTPIVYRGRPYVLVDTAGIRRKGRVDEPLEKLAVLMALRSLERSRVAIIVIDASESVTAQDAHIAGYAQDAGRAAVLVVNKWDLVPRGLVSKAEVVEQIQDRLLVPRLRARVLHLGARGRGDRRSLRRHRPRGGRGAPPGAHRGGDGGRAQGAGAASGHDPRRAAHRRGRRAGQRQSADVRRCA